LVIFSSEELDDLIELSVHRHQEHREFAKASVELDDLRGRLALPPHRRIVAAWIDRSKMTRKA
jgi:hypothetical protein